MSLFSGEDAYSFLVFPDASSNKYSRGVAGLLTGSDRFPGAGVLSSKGALRSGAGFCRYIGENQFCNSLVLNSCPEIVIGEGKCDSFLVGSGISDISQGPRGDLARRLLTDPSMYRKERGWLVLDAGAMDLILDFTSAVPIVITPHSGELQRLFKKRGIEVEAQTILKDPVHFAKLASDLFSCAVLLKGATTVVAFKGFSEEVKADCHYLACAGTGDVLAGFLTGFLALTKPKSERELVRTCAVAAYLHNLSAKIASKSFEGPGHPIIASDVADNLPNAYLWAARKDKLE
ncbi:MAG: NAD(P)H-hydrate dehydratase [Aeriscardovia sp.]|nr:NAD(P)H-hydrate dehydratase [Aeriscardovia sp.]MBQ5500090.1 NAD(P)H-hydrate dehydratase [Aeriscardovia sp.]